MIADTDSKARIPPRHGIKVEVTQQNYRSSVLKRGTCRRC
jgi:hypothetical protein